MSDTGRLFMYMGIFGGFTVLVYFACMWMVKIEENRRKKR